MKVLLSSYNIIYARAKKKARIRQIFPARIFSSTESWASSSNSSGSGARMVVAPALYAAPEDLKPDYYPTSESVQQLNVNAEGKPQEIIFFYTYRAPATPAPAYVVVQYVDREGNPVAQEGRLTGTPGQEMTVYAAPENLQDYYVLDDGSLYCVVRVK